MDREQQALKMQTMDHQAMQHQMAENGLSGQTITGDHLMAGIPDWLYYLSIVIVMLLSFLIFNVVRHRPNKLENYFKLELTRFRPVKLMIKSRGVQLSVQLILVFLFLVILYAGFYGNQHSGRNIAPSLTWNIWWVGLIFIILLLWENVLLRLPVGCFDKLAAEDVLSESKRPRIVQSWSAVAETPEKYLSRHYLFHCLDMDRAWIPRDFKPGKNSDPRFSNVRDGIYSRAYF